MRIHPYSPQGDTVKGDALEGNILLNTNNNNKDKEDKHPYVRCEHVDSEYLQTV